VTVEFALSAGRDLLLLIVGALLTLLGSWLSSRATAKRETVAARARAENEAAERDRATAERVRGLVFDLYVEARTWNQAGRQNPLRFNEVTFHSAEMGAELIRDERIRTLLDQAFYLARNAGATTKWRTIDESAPRAQTTAQYDALQILAAYIRGDSVEGEFSRRIESRRNGVVEALRLDEENHRSRH